MNEILTQLVFWSSLVSILIAMGIVGFIVYWRTGFKIPVWVFEKDGNNVINLRRLAAKLVRKDDNVKFQIFTWNFWDKSKIQYIKPITKCTDSFQQGSKHMLMVCKQSDGKYVHVRYDYNSDAFENIPSEVSYWASITRKEREMVHTTGVNWAVVAPIAITSFALIICLVMVIFTLDYVQSVNVGGGAVQAVNTSIPLLG